MTPQRVTLITLGVATEVVFYQIHGAVLGLFGREALAKDQGREGVRLETGATTLAQNFSSEAEVDAAFQIAIDAGATELKRPEKVFWGGYSGYYVDPDGHVWEMAMNPFWPLSEDGSLTLPAEA